MTPAATLGPALDYRNEARAVGQIDGAMQLAAARTPSAARPRVLATSAVDRSKVREAWAAAEAFATAQRDSGALMRRRR